ncbi:MAG: hypothetical protein ACT4NP_10805 [Pseudonocardiales bacterium]
MERQPALFDPDRRFEFLIGECALHWNPAPATDIHAGLRIADPEDVELYRGLYDRLRERAATGADAVALIRRVAADQRGRGST